MAQLGASQRGELRQAVKVALKVDVVSVCERGYVTVLL